MDINTPNHLANGVETVMDKTPRVLVLILTFNGRHLLEESLPSYLANDYENFGVVVIDNGSRDDIQEWVQLSYPTVHVLRSDRNLGYSLGFNLGLDYAFNSQKADYAIVTNDDVRADPKVIAELVKVAESDSKIGFVTGKVYYYDDPNKLQTVGKHEDPIRWNGGHIGNREIDQGQYDKVSERAFVDDVYTLVRRELYYETGGYDGTFKFECEEYDWQARAKNLGYKIYFTPHAKLWHKVSMTLGKGSPILTFYDVRNPMIVLLKYKDPLFFRRYFRLHVKEAVRASLVAMKQLRPLVSLAVWRGLFSGVTWGVRHRKLTLRHLFPIA